MTDLINEEFIQFGNGVEVKEVRLSRLSRCVTLRLKADGLNAVEKALLKDRISASMHPLNASVQFDAPDAPLEAGSSSAENEVDAGHSFQTIPGSIPAVTHATAPMTGTDGRKESVLLFGKGIRSTKFTRISALRESQMPAIIDGELVSFEEADSFRSKKEDGKTIWKIHLNITDHSDSIYCVCSFFEEDKKNAFLAQLSDLSKGKYRFSVKGIPKTNVFSKPKELMLFVSDISYYPMEERMDTSDLKRVELHLHTKMSTMDALTDVKAAFQAAKRFGHKALAITDHGVVQAFPEAAKASKDSGVKAILGVEGYLQSDSVLVPFCDRSFVVFDIETTGLKAQSCEIIEIGAIKVRNGEIIDRFSTFIDDGCIIPSNITALTRITNQMIAGSPSTREALSSFSDFLRDSIPVAHNARFDMGFIREHGARYGIDFSMPFADTLMLSKYLLPELINHKLDTVCDHYGIDISGHHRAIDDATATADVFLRLLQMLEEREIRIVPLIIEKNEEGEGRKRRISTNHVILLASTQAGLKNLYRIVSAAHLDHFRGKPTIPRSLLSLFRTGLIVGSACEQGDLYQAILHEEPEDKIRKIASFYDYLEIQPDGNNMFLVRNGTLADTEALHEINRKIVTLGDELGIPVAATGDVHFLEPDDSIYRQIIMMKMGFEDAAMQPPLYFKTTDQMLEEFSYLGPETARRVVIDVPNAIADRCETLKPFPDGTHSPKIPDAEKILSEMAMTRAHELYGDPLPEIVQARLDKELKSIIGNGFSSLYLLAVRLVRKSNSDGYLVGSRGSVGSSFVATMSGITEVNPLPPHYVCPKCRHSDFDVDRELYSCGVDMPDLNCPVCGTPYRKEGFDIPFEVFLGFKGDKTPDIDLNFSGEYQPVAHKYVEEMFGHGHAFRAGTISGLAERKAVECVENYAEQTGKRLRKAEIERLSKGCMNVKVTTGQHPGGIVIVPIDEDIMDFTPVQYPADKKDKDTITTHFDFHAMDDRLVKLDILGHDDPTALRMLEDLTGLNPRTIPLDDPDTRSIFSSIGALKIDLSALGVDVGSIGVPEFGTGFVRGVLKDTRPKKMEELIRIAGLTHGTDVWLNNAQPLVLNGIAKLSDVLCTRDDIMNYLIAHGMEPSLSFKIMERVRKGKGLTEDMETALTENRIPEWFIDSCHKIKYMFPRGHAVAYTMMAFRIAYFKVHYPLEFYAVYFTVRADAFDITRSLGGAQKVLDTIHEINRGLSSKEYSAQKLDKELITILEVIYEMNLRGIEMLPVDIYRSQGSRFIVEGNGIRPPFTSVPGIGASAAESLVYREGTRKYLSIEDYRARTRANSGIIGLLETCGCFGDLPQENQISLF